MNVADLALLILWLVFFVRGYFNGLVREAGSLAALVFAFYAAKTWRLELSPHLAPYISGDYTEAAACILIFVVVMFAAWLVALALSALLKIGAAQWADRLFGGVFGLLKGVAVTAAALFFLTMFMPRPEFLAASKLVPVLDQIVTTLTGHIPPDLMRRINDLKDETPA